MKNSVRYGTPGRMAVLIAVTSSTNGRSAGTVGRESGPRAETWDPEADRWSIRNGIGHLTTSTPRRSGLLGLGGLSCTVANCVPETGAFNDAREEALPFKISIETVTAVEVGNVRPVPIRRTPGSRAQSEGVPRISVKLSSSRRNSCGHHFDALSNDLAPKHRRVAGYRHRSGCG